MATTRPVIRRKAAVLAGYDLAWASADGSSGLTASGGTSTSLVDAAVAPPNGYSSQTHRNWHIYLPANAAADQVRVVSSYSGAAREWHIPTGEDYATAPANSDVYLILKDHPFEWETALNLALTQKCAFVRYAEFDPTLETTLRYDITAAPISITAADITSKAQFRALQWRNENDAAGEEQWYDYHGTWDVEFDEDTYRLILPSGVGLNTARTWRLVYTMPYTALADEVTTSNVDPDYAAWATLLTLGERLGDHNNPDDTWEVVRREASMKYEEYHRRALGRYSGRVVIQPARRRFGVSVMGRRG